MNIGLNEELIERCQGGAKWSPFNILNVLNTETSMDHQDPMPELEDVMKVTDNTVDIQDS